MGQGCEIKRHSIAQVFLWVLRKGLEPTTFLKDLSMGQGCVTGIKQKSTWKTDAPLSSRWVLFKGLEPTTFHKDLSKRQGCVTGIKQKRTWKTDAPLSSRWVLCKGLEPTTIHKDSSKGQGCVTGIKQKSTWKTDAPLSSWWARRDSNPRPHGCELCSVVLLLLSSIKAVLTIRVL